MSAACTVGPTFEVLGPVLEITGSLRTASALRVGAGRDIAPDSPDLPVMRDVLGRPFIPGSSLKGVLRSRLEALVRGLAPADPDVQRHCACLITEESKLCVTAAERKALLKAADKDDAAYMRELLKQTCLVCRVFGSPWFAGRLRVADLMLQCDGGEGATPRRTVEIRNGVAIDRDTGTASSGKLYQFEAAVAGLDFGLHLTAENLSPVERGLVLMGVRLLQQGELTIGGSRSRGLGAVSFGSGPDIRACDPAASVEALVKWLARDSAGTQLTEGEIDADLKATAEYVRGGCVCTACS